MDNQERNNFILHIAGLILLSGLAIFFGILEAKYKVQTTDIGILLGILGGLVGVHASKAKGDK